MKSLVVFSAASLLAMTSLSNTVLANTGLVERSIDLLKNEDPVRRAAGLTGIMLSLGQSGSAGAEIESALDSNSVKQVLTQVHGLGLDAESDLAESLIDEYDHQIGKMSDEGRWSELGTVDDSPRYIVPRGDVQWLTLDALTLNSELALEASCPSEITVFSECAPLRYTSGLSFRGPVAESCPSRMRVRAASVCPDTMHVQGVVLGKVEPWPEGLVSGKPRLVPGKRYEISWSEDSSTLMARVPVMAGRIYHVFTLNSSSGIDPLLEATPPGVDEGIKNDDSSSSSLESSVRFFAIENGDARVRLTNLEDTEGLSELGIWYEEPVLIGVGETELWLEDSQAMQFPTESGRTYQIETIVLDEGVDPFLVAIDSGTSSVVVDDDGGAEPLAARVEVRGTGNNILIEVSRFPGSQARGRVIMKVRALMDYAYRP